MSIQQTPPPDQPPAPPQAKRKKPPSRSQRWADAVAEAKEALDQVAGLIDAVESGFSNLKDVQDEYSEWKDNLPENLASSPLGEKLEEVCNLDLESAASALRSAVDDAQSALDDAEGVELPRGFGRD